MTWFKAAPGVWHIVDKILGHRFDRTDCLALCGRRALVSDPPIDTDPPEKEQQCNMCKKYQQDK
jgi:hypothetical protein